MNAIITFFMWLFGWTSVQAPAPVANQIPTMTPITSQPTSVIDGFEPERFKTGQNQTVTIIIYDDTHFRVK